MAHSTTNKRGWVRRFLAGFGGWFNIFGWRRRKQLARQFQAWLAQQPSDEAQLLHEWFAKLSPKEMKLFTEQVNQHCEAASFHLSWLLDGRLADAPDLQLHLTEVVLNYAVADHKVRQVQTDIQAFIAFRDWQANPKGRQQVQFGQKLFAELTERGVIADISFDRLFASEKKRQAYIIQTINQVAQTDRQIFNTILKRVVLSDEQIQKRIYSKQAKSKSAA